MTTLATRQPKRREHKTSAAYYYTTLMFGFYWGLLSKDSRTYDLDPNVRLPISNVPILCEKSCIEYPALEETRRGLVESVAAFAGKWDEVIDDIDSHSQPYQHQVVEGLIDKVRSCRMPLATELKKLEDELSSKLPVARETAGGLVIIGYYAKHYLSHPIEPTLSRI